MVGPCATSYTRRECLAAFQLEGKPQVWWDWVKVSRDIEAMTWGEFHELFMGKYFSNSTRHAKAQEFLEDNVKPGKNSFFFLKKR